MVMTILDGNDIICSQEYSSMDGNDTDGNDFLPLLSQPIATACFPPFKNYALPTSSKQTCPRAIQDSISSIRIVQRPWMVMTGIKIRGNFSLLFPLLCSSVKSQRSTVAFFEKLARFANVLITRHGLLLPLWVFQGSFRTVDGNDTNCIGHVFSSYKILKSVFLYKTKVA